MHLLGVYTTTLLRLLLELPREIITGDGITITTENIVKKVQFKLHSRDNEEPEYLFPRLRNEILRRRIDKPIKIIIHGYLETGDTLTSKTLRTRFLNVSDVTTITVDWGKASVFPIYGKARENTEAVGRYLAMLVDWLVEEGADPANIHIIGHSLGGQIAGIAGSNLRNGRKVGRITGLDPALPGFNKTTPTRRLDKSDADFVDVIHTSDGLYGDPGPLGHADFYVNGGTHQQPGCLVIDGGVCSHIRSVDYFAESIYPNHIFIAAKCPDKPRKGPSGCNHTNYHMGNYLDTSASGLFYVQTHDKYPFANEVLGE